MSDGRFNHEGFAERRFWLHFGRRREGSVLERSEASNRVEDLRVGHRVEFELQYGFERPCAVNIKRLHRDGQRPGAPIDS